ncbi:hypothetical protein ACIBK8_34390 [Streptomyces sp. NPDC050161]|uniref:hypothetical protein n=1 Tax=Streptomyces sp. NPDC050161 TaxID=3365604 RepID=UPI0037B9B947
MTGPLRAADVPEIRAELTAWLADAGGAHWGREFALRSAAELPQEYRSDPYGAAAALAHRAAAGLRDAEMYYVAGEMAQLAAAAGERLPAYRLHHEELPAERGLLIWEVPCAVHRTGPLRVPVRAASWAPHGSGVEVILWGLTDDWIAEQERVSRVSGNRLRAQLPALDRIASGVLPYGQPPRWLGPAGWESEQDHDWHARAERTVLATWLLMGQQTLVHASRTQAPRSAVRRIRRLDPGVPTRITSVQLRRAMADGQPSGARERRGHHHRWMVRGHWRKQWLPAREAHRPVWVSQHVRGPLGAPLLGAERVGVLRH